MVRGPEKDISALPKFHADAETSGIMLFGAEAASGLFVGRLSALQTVIYHNISEHLSSCRLSVALTKTFSG